MRILATLLIFTLAAFQFATAQLATRLDQIYQDFSFVNGAAINANSKSSVNLFYNRLFTGIKGSPTNMMASALFPNPEKRVGFGVNLGQEKIGFSTLYNVYATYAYTIPVNKKTRFHLGVSAGILSQKFNPNAIDVINQDDPYYLSLQQGKPDTKFDLKGSIAFQYSSLLMGFSLGRVTQPRFTYEYFNYKAQYQLSNLSNAFVAAKLKLSKDFVMQPIIDVNIFDFSSTLTQFGINLYVRDVIWAGVHHAGNRNVSLHLGANIKNMVKIGYSYSVPYSASSTLLGSGHEFFTSILLGKTSDLVSDFDFEPLTLTRPLDSNGNTASNTNKNGQQSTNTNKEQNRVAPSSNVVSVETIKMRSDTIVINSFDEMKFLKTGYDTSKIFLGNLEKAYPNNGYYVTVGVFKSEDNANRHIKNLYLKGITAYKFYMPENDYYYVFIFKGETPQEADDVKWQGQLEIPDIWTKRVYKK